jgi:low affinity Fe/Cu permease
VGADRRRRGGVGRALETIAHQVTEWTGTSWAFGSAVAVIVVWAVSGPIFGFSDTWQLVINTGTTIVTFLMVFLIQRAQNKDTIAIHLKLNEIVAALEGASNRLINVEDLTEEEILTLRRHYRRLVEIARHEESLTRSHSIEEAEARHRVKVRRRRQIAASSLEGEARPSLSEPTTRGGVA